MRPEKYPLFLIGGKDSFALIEVKGTYYHQEPLNRLFRMQGASDNTEFFADVQLVPEPDNPHSESGSAISVRWDNEVIGYVPSEQSNEFGQLRRIAASGFDATIQARFWTNKRGDGRRDFWVSIQLSPDDLLIPLNDPPLDGFGVLPKGSAIQVTKEEDHLNVLTEYLPPAGRGQVLLTLHVIHTSTGKERIEARLDGERVGELTPASSGKYAPVVRHWEDLGLMTVAHARIEGSSVSVQLTLYAAKAFELSEAQLDPDDTAPLPKLVAYQADPDDYAAPNRYQRVQEDPLPRKRESHASFTTSPQEAQSHSGYESRGQFADKNPFIVPQNTAGNVLNSPDKSAPSLQEWEQLLAPDGSPRATPFQRGYVRGNIGKHFPSNKAPRMDYLTKGQAERVLTRFGIDTEPLYKGGRNSMALWNTLVVFAVIFAIGGIGTAPGGLIITVLVIALFGHHFWIRKKLEYPFRPRE